MWSDSISVLDNFSMWIKSDGLYPSGWFVEKATPKPRTYPLRRYGHIMTVRLRYVGRMTRAVKQPINQPIFHRKRRLAGITA
jgi:hypothetical protein